MTLNTIQTLYERKLTTYPRVDTQFLSDDILSKVSTDNERTLSDYICG